MALVSCQLVLTSWSEAEDAVSAISEGALFYHAFSRRAKEEVEGKYSSYAKETYKPKRQRRRGRPRKRKLHIS